MKGTNRTQKSLAKPTDSTDLGSKALQTSFLTEDKTK